MTASTAPSLTTGSEVSAPRLIVPWWAVALPALAFIMLGLICRGPNTLGIDLNVSHWVQDRASWWAEPLAVVGNTIGEAPVAISLLVASVVLGVILKRRRELWFLLLVAIGRLLATGLKGFFDSPRPTREQIRLHEVFDGYGFPSGHTLTSTLVAGTLVFLLARQFPRRGVYVALGLYWPLAIACTAFARIWVGAHWFTDTVGGALFGVFVVLLAANLSLVLVNRWPGPTSRSEFDPIASGSTRLTHQQRSSLPPAQGHQHDPEPQDRERHQADDHVKVAIRATS